VRYERLGFRDRLEIRLRRVPSGADEVDSALGIPGDVARRLIDDNPFEPLWRHFRQYGKGQPGVTQETDSDWVIRDARGKVVGGVVADQIAPGHPVSLDVAIDPWHRRQGYATQLYQALAAAGIDEEAGSDASLRRGTMTYLGYAFMVGRRRKTKRSSGSSR